MEKKLQEEVVIDALCILYHEEHRVKIEALHAVKRQERQQKLKQFIKESLISNFFANLAYMGPVVLPPEEESV